MKRQFATCLLLSSLIAAACGSGDASTEFAAEATAATTAATTAAPDPSSTAISAEGPTAPPPGGSEAAVVTERAHVVLDETGCTSSIPETWPSGVLEIEISNRITGRMALVIGTYAAGFDHQDLVEYGTDVSTRPPFINALEIFEVGPASTRQVSFDHGPGRYFAACMPSSVAMTVLDDLVVGD
jgi:hypothetical protein